MEWDVKGCKSLLGEIIIMAIHDYKQPDKIKRQGTYYQYTANRYLHSASFEDHAMMVGMKYTTNQMLNAIEKNKNNNVRMHHYIQKKTAVDQNL